MKEITVGMKFQNRANKRVGQVVSIDLATSNAVLNVETANGQYKESKVSLAGLLGQKSWKYIHDEEVAGDGTPMNEVMQEILSDEELAAKKKLEAMLAPADESINKAKSKAKAKVDAEIKQKAEEVKKADAEAAKAEKEAEKAENELLAHYQKDLKQKKQKQPESVKKEQAPAEKKAEKKEKPVKEKKERTSKISADEKLAKVNDIVAIINKINVGIPKVYDKKFMVAIFVGKKRMVEFYPRADKISVWCRDVIAEQFAEYSPVFHTTCGMKYQFYITTTKEVEKVIKTINKEEK